MNKISKIKPASPLAIFSERLGVDESELQAVIMKTVMPANVSVTNEQFLAFMAVANAYALNPLKKEIFAFPGKGNSIQPIVSIDGWLSIINSRPQFDGLELIENHDDNGALVSVTCKIYRNDRSQPVVVTEWLEECLQSTEPWKKKPRRMLRHKATIQCARYAFGLGGIMEEDEAMAAFGGERDVSPAPSREEPAELPAYPEHLFFENLPKWQKLIEGGRKTADEIVDTIETKGLLTQGQVEAIQACAPIDSAIIGELVE